MLLRVFKNGGGTWNLKHFSICRKWKPRLNFYISKTTREVIVEGLIATSPETPVHHDSITIYAINWYEGGTRVGPHYAERRQTFRQFNDKNSSLEWRSYRSRSKFDTSNFIFSDVYFFSFSFAQVRKVFFFLRQTKMKLSIFLLFCELKIANVTRNAFSKSPPLVLGWAVKVFRS